MWAPRGPSAPDILTASSRMAADSVFACLTPICARSFSGFCTTELTSDYGYILLAGSTVLQDCFGRHGEARHCYNLSLCRRVLHTLLAGR